MTSAQDEARPHVVVVGSGFGGSVAAGGSCATVVGSALVSPGSETATEFSSEQSFGAQRDHEQHGYVGECVPHAAGDVATTPLLHQAEHDRPGDHAAEPAAVSRATARSASAGAPGAGYCMACSVGEKPEKS